MRFGTSLILVFLALVTSTEAERRSSDCNPFRHDRLLIASSNEALVYRTRPTTYSVAYFACPLRSRRITRIGYAVDFGDYVGGPATVPDGRSVAINGHIVGFLRVTCAEGGGCTSVARAFDSRSGRRTTQLKSDRGIAGAYDKLVVTTSGHIVVVYGEAQDATLNSKYNESVVADNATLDHGPTVDPDSLSVTGNRLYWISDDQPRTAYLTR